MKISVVTPSYNQGRFIERTIRSVLDQAGDFELEYVVVDGGSNDKTLDILRSFGSRLKWKSEPDKGQSDAINKGFRQAGGDILAWLNSDDTYEQGALAAVADEYRREPFAWCFGNCRVIDEHDREIRSLITRYKTSQGRKYSLSRLLRRDFISQPAVFFAKSAWEQSGDLALDLVFSMDYDYWLRLGRKYEPRHIDRTLANFRWHGQSKNGALYRKAAWEAFQTARKHAGESERLAVVMHYFHYQLLRVLYFVM